MQEASRNLFNAELNESASLRSKLNALIALYKSLGGGWVQEDARSVEVANEESHTGGESQTVVVD